MTITSAGYSGTVTQEDWALMAQFSGVDSAVATSDGCVVTGTAGTRVVSVSPGLSWGWGVLATLSGTNTISLAANGSGSTRWDAIVLRRNWSTETTTLEAVTGTSVEEVPALTVNPGVQADQVLALVAVPSGATDLTGATVRRHVQWAVQTTSGQYQPQAPSYGQRWVDLSTGRPYSWDGSAWVDASSTPVGTIVMYGGTSAPAGWHLCDGTAHGSAALQAVLGSANAPDLRDRFIVGAGASYARGATGGAASVTLTAAQSGIPAHSHSASAGSEASHTHGAGSLVIGSQLSSYFVNYMIQGSDSANNNVWFAAQTPETLYNTNQHNHTISGSTGGGTSHSHSVTVNSSPAASASSSHENRPPYYAATYIIRKL